MNLTSGCGRSAALAVIVAAVVLGLGGCGTTTASSSPSVANISTTTIATYNGRTAITVPKNTAAESLVEWANCMRGHGDPNQPDPTIDSRGGINIFIPGSAASLSNGVHNGTAPCHGYLAAASADLRAGVTDLTPPDQDALVKYSQCMRANGVPNYPDPGTGGTTNFNGTGIDLNSPFFLRANDKCGKQVGASICFPHLSLARMKNGLFGSMPRPLKFVVPPVPGSG